jgi:hypothetical protein
MQLTNDEVWELPAPVRNELNAWLREIGVFNGDFTEWLVSITIGEGFVDTIEEDKATAEQCERRVFTKISPPRRIFDLMVARSMSGRAT